MSEPCPVLQARGGWFEDQLAGRCRFPIAPVNTWSNAAYLAAGVAAVALVRSPASVAFGLAMAFLAVGSALYHGYKTVAMARLDHAGMYGALGVLGTYVLAPRHPLIGLVMLASGAVLAWQLAASERWKDVLYPVVGVLVWLALAAVLLRGRVGYGGAAALSLALAWAAWWADKQRTFPVRRWGHGVWHVLTAAALLALFLGASP